MRKVTWETAQAFWGGYNKKNGNTKVVVNRNIVDYYLHGNLIASRFLDDQDLYMHFSMCSWGSVTTRERLNGLFSIKGIQGGLSQCNHQQKYIDRQGNSQDIDPCAVYVVEINTGKVFEDVRYR
jgi:hypothetical protein